MVVRLYATRLRSLLRRASGAIRGRAVTAPHAQSQSIRGGAGSQSGRPYRNKGNSFLSTTRRYAGHAGLYTSVINPRETQASSVSSKLPARGYATRRHAHSAGGPRNTRRTPCRCGRRSTLNLRKGLATPTPWSAHKHQGRRLSCDDSFAGLAAQRKGALRLSDMEWPRAGHAHGSSLPRYTPNRPRP